jgi:hypothetical protein
MGVKKKKNGGADGRERVALKNEVVARVRKSKEVTGVPIAQFFERVATSELNRMDLENAEKVGGKK